MNVSIIIPALNEAEQIESTIRCCHAHDSLGVLSEVIVCDGGSMDQTLEIARASGAECVLSERPGRALQMNHGASRAKGDFLLFVHADTRLPVGWSHCVKESVDKGFEAGCFRLAFDHPSPILRLYGWLTRFDLDFMRFGDQGLFISSDHFHRLGGFREDHRVLEDNEFTRRIRASGIRFDVMKKAAITSARRYLEQGELRLQLIFVAIYTMWRLGVPQDQLVAFYRSKVTNRVPE